MITLKDLQTRYPYQFAGPTISLDFARGWFPLFVQLCEDIDHALGPDKRGFHWRQVKQKFGQARVYFQLGTDKGKGNNNDSESEDRQDFEGRAELMKQLLQLQRAMESACARRCAACGEVGTVRAQSGSMLALCDLHHRQRAAGELVPVWIEG